MSWPFPSRRADPIVRAYVDATPRRPRGRAPLAEVNFIVVDSEATGFNITHDRMLSLATVAVRNGQMSVNRTHNWFICQPAAPLTAAVAVHGILPSESARGTAEIEVLRELLPLLGGAVLVGHHARFDAEMINAALLRHFKTKLRNPLVDTAHLAMGTLEAFRKSGYAGQRPPSLEEVCALSQIEMIERHTAVGDAFTTAEVFLLLCAKVRRMVRHREPRLGDLLPVRF